MTIIYIILYYIQECEFGGPEWGPCSLSDTGREIVNSNVWNSRLIGYVY